MIEFVSIFCQCLSTLQYLNENDSSIMHRDVKSSNIFVQCKNSNYIHVKFEDFDLSKNYAHLSIICDIYDYFASEIYQIVITVFADVDWHEMWIEYEISIIAKKKFLTIFSKSSYLSKKNIIVLIIISKNKSMFDAIMTRECRFSINSIDFLNMFMSSRRKKQFFKKFQIDRILKKKLFVKNYFYL